MSQIQFSQDYDSFQLFHENRAISSKHAESFVNDPSFKNTFKYHPIIVNEKMQIIDGQHRFFAARKLNIPIYFIIQPNAGLDTIKNYNVQQLRWSERDYLQFYSRQGKEEYIYLENIKKRYSLSLTNIIYPICKIDNKDRSKTQKDFKHGNFKVRQKDQVNIFFEELAEGMENLTKYHKLEEYKHIITRHYFATFAVIFIEDRKLFKKLMNKLYLVFNSLPYTANMSQAYEFVLKAANKNIRYA